MAMSSDRVEFTFTDNTNQRGANLAAAERAFGMCAAEARLAFDNCKRIRCRPSQFARFLIYRSDLVDCNRFASLRPKLIPAVPAEDFVDVSRNSSE